MNWRILLGELFELRKVDEEARLFYEPLPPSGLPFPEHLRRNQDIEDFYRICDGGYIGEINWCPIAKLPDLNDEWNQHLFHYYPNGAGPISPQTHTVLGNDAGGAPLIWDATEDIFRSFWFKGGDWEGDPLTFEQYMQDFFTPEKQHTGWAEVLAKLVRRVSK